MPAPKLTISECFENALVHHRAGHIGQAVDLYEQILANQPRNADALHMIGVARHQEGNHETAEAYIRQALDITGPHPTYLGNLGGVLQAQDRLDEAEDVLREALGLKPDYAEALSNLGNILRKKGKYEDALENYDMAIRLNPKFPSALSNRGNVLLNLGRPKDAEDSYRRALAINPNHLDTLLSLSNLLLRRGQVIQAIAMLRRAEKVQPDHVGVNTSLATALRDNGKIDEACAVLKRLLEKDPTYAEGYSTLGNVYQLAGDLEEAVKAHRKAVELKPNFAGGYMNLGNALGQLGRFDEAREAYEAALRIQPDAVMVHYNLSGTKKYQPDDPDLAALERIHASGNYAPEVAVNLNFTLGKAHHDCKNYDRAFTFFAEGNRLKRQEVKYDGQSEETFFNKIKQLYAPQLFADFAEAGIRGAPVAFIVGMPRSGTSLVEQILASHPQVVGAGELLNVQEMLFEVSRNETNKPYPDSFQTIKPDTITTMAQTYLDRTARYREGRPDARYMTDKMPINFLHAGAIRLMFPDAPIIHCRRNPLDTCLSCFMKMFTYGNMFAFDQKSLAHFYRLYDGMMAHWRKVLPGPFIEVSYERMIDDQETETRKLLDIMGLDWDSACLDFHKNARAVRTASLAQVRKPIYSTSVKGWRNYEQQLQPLVKALGLEEAARRGDV